MVGLGNAQIGSAGGIPIEAATRPGEDGKANKWPRSTVHSLTQPRVRTLLLLASRTNSVINGGTANGYREQRQRSRLRHSIGLRGR